MNEQIKELALQAGFNLPNNLVEGANGPGVVTEKDKLEKFAELIVRECADVATINQYQAFTPGYYVKKHFGVEL
jgi:hypothetical protein